MVEEGGHGELGTLSRKSRRGWRSRRGRRLLLADGAGDEGRLAFQTFERQVAVEIHPVPLQSVVDDVLALAQLEAPEHGLRAFAVLRRALLREEELALRQLDLEPVVADLE